jgi:thiol-disulfide isomerase/thioredoxin
MMFTKKLAWCNGLLAVTMLAGSLMGAPKVGRKMADVTVDLPGARRMKVTDGKAVVRVVVMLSTTCEHCMKAIPSLNKVAKEFRSKGVKFVGVIVDEGQPGGTAQFINNTKPTFPVGSVTQDNARRLGDYGFKDHPFVPVAMFLNANDIVMYQFAGDETLMKGDVERGVKGMVELMLRNK